MAADFLPSSFKAFRRQWNTVSTPETSFYHPLLWQPEDSGKISLKVKGRVINPKFYIQQKYPSGMKAK